MTGQAPVAEIRRLMDEAAGDHETVAGLLGASDRLASACIIHLADILDAAQALYRDLASVQERLKSEWSAGTPYEESPSLAPWRQLTGEVKP